MKKAPSLPKKSKAEKQSENYLRVVEQCFAGKQYRPLTFNELTSKLTIIEEHIPLFKTILDNLIHENKLTVKEGRYYPVESRNDVLQGVIRMNPRGFGFVEVEDINFPDDIFVPKAATKNAVDGDLVEVVISPSSFSEKGPEGRVIAILSRSRSHLGGIVTSINNRSAMVYVPILGADQPVILELPTEEPIIEGDRIVMKVMEWGSGQEATRVQLSHKIGHISDPSCDVAAALEEFEIRSDFPSAVVEEATQIGSSVSQKDIKDREDLRELETFTIDPDTAKDFDDALSLSKDKKGIYHLAVHIADVSHYVPAGSLLDKEAFLRSNSTYFPGTCIPMLPKELSDHLCSLKPKVNRLTVTAFMDFDEHGEMLNYRICRSVIRSAKRFTYKEAKKVLDGTLKSPHTATLKLMEELCYLLKKKRYIRGSVEFAMPELVILVDEKGKPTGTDYVTYDITHQLVEEFMLKANETVARHLDLEGKGVPFRVHDEPSEENMRDFSVLANAFGFKLAPKPTPQDVQKLFEEAMSTPSGQYLATSYIRRMRLAIYSPVNIGHFGLALTHYCHFTSPIRRYVDLVAHRLIFEKATDLRALEKIADRCSERERISAKAEGSVVVLKKYRLLDEYYRKDPERQYEAVITRIKSFGFFFEILELMLEGFIHISEIGSDFYHYDGSNLRGVDNGEIFLAGNKITVMLKDLNLITCTSNWHRVSDEPTQPNRSRKRKPHRR